MAVDDSRKALDLRDATRKNPGRTGQAKRLVRLSKAGGIPRYSSNGLKTWQGGNFFMVDPFTFVIDAIKTSSHRLSPN